MTKKEKQYQEKSDFLMYHIEYELKEGIHTYHQCECGRGGCRSKCLRCLVDKFLDWKDSE